MESVQRHSDKNIRTFVAVRVQMDSKGIKTLEAIQKSLQNENIRWVTPENFHITLRFIGDTSAEAISTIGVLLEMAAKNTHSFKFIISGIGVFRSISYPRVLWLGTLDDGSLIKLQSDTDEALSGVIKIDKLEKFRSHLTIGRMKNIADPKILEKILKEYAEHRFLEVNVKEIILFESVLFSGGPKYRVVSAHPLK